MNEQLTIPMPVIAVQVTLRAIPGRGYELVARSCRQDQGWQTVVTGRYEDQRTASLDVPLFVDEAWSAPPLD